ncbi:transcription termination/antitermination protein NusA [Clostridium sp. 'deep sea']|uniref:transcription termination factor NusA n=1 Tax=Clostridium sp. 'deep sea' TaxID=2779445 RepID=UPI00189693FE|nr:transcription termination factor NusA [Clostridium sp. 'deep sea']QOR36023.1 transcription termination/antitermination protein NusA [Clostridium sp. 'deep sea']
MNREFIKAIKDLGLEKGIDQEILYDAVETALKTSYKNQLGSTADIKVVINRLTGDVKVYRLYEVVEEVNHKSTELLLEDAIIFNRKAKTGEIVEVEITTKEFGRKAAQNAKQMVVQRIREAERNVVYDRYIDKTDDIITALLHRSDGKNFYVDLNNTEAILPPTEQVAGETYQVGERIKVYVTEVRKTSKGPQIVVSRTHPGLIKRLFELEVPEIYNGTVEIKSIAREAGSRTKIAVHAADKNVDPVGACVGPKGTRVQSIVAEINGEKIDIVEWSDDPRVYVKNALCPSKVLDVGVESEDEHKVKAVVPDHQLSLAIGREGQNARLAARLTSWKIDIKSASQAGFETENDLG